MITTVGLKESHDYPLSPMSKLDYKSGVPVYLEKIVGVFGGEYSKGGWFVWDWSVEDFLSLESIGSGSISENLMGWAELDGERTMGRLLQTGEVLSVNITG